MKNRSKIEKINLRSKNAHPCLSPIKLILFRSDACIPSISELIIHEWLSFLIEIAATKKLYYSIDFNLFVLEIFSLFSRMIVK